MRRAALARWLNLTVIAAVVAVLTLVLVSTPPRVVRAADVCGQDGSPTVDADMTIDWGDGRSISGPPGTWTGVDVTWPVAPASFDLIVVWRPDEPGFAEQIASDDFSDTGNTVGFDFNVPGGAEPGTYFVGVCWSSDNGVTWNSVDPDEYLSFTVESSTDPCYGTLPDSAGESLVLTPDSGYYPSTFDATGVTIESFPGQVVQLIWDWVQPFELNPPLGTVIATLPVPEGNGGTVTFEDVPVPAPPLGSVGPHNVALCYFDGFSWYFVDTAFGLPSIYTVLENIPDISTCSEGTPSTAHSLFYEAGNTTLHSGPPGTEDSARLSALGGGEPSLDGWVYSLVWDVDTPDPFVLAQFFANFEPYHIYDFTVPYDAESGLHTIGVCYLYDNDGTWEWRPAGSTIQFNVGNPVPCGTVGQTGNTGELIGLVPNQGQIGSTFVASISAVELGLEDALLVQVIWDWVEGNSDNPPGGQVMTQITKSDTTNQAAVTAIVPTQAALGPHNVNICYYVPLDVGSFSVGPAESSFGEWIAGEPSIFNVVEAGTSTPTVPPTTTPEPDDEEPEPTATLAPTATLPPVVPIQGPPVTPTIVVSTIAALAPTATPGAGGPTTPGGGLPGGGGPNPSTGAQETTTPGTSTPAATSTPAPTATRAPTTPTPTPTPTATTAPSSGDVEGSRTEFVASVKSFHDISDDFDVILTNALLTGVFLLLIFLTSEIFNQTIRDNQTEVEGWLHSFFGPIIGIWAGLSHLMGVATLGNQKLKDLVWLALVLVVTVLIEGFLNPDFGINKASLLLFVSLLVAVGFVTYLTEGGEAFVARTFFGQDTAVRVFPAAIGIALVCVIMSRLGNFVPGILYGFVGTAIFLRPNTMNADQEGKHIFFPMAMMLALSVGAWLLVDQFRGANPSDFDVVMEGILVGVFIATIESVAINMLPIAYMDGRKLMAWNPLVWVTTSAVALFLLWTVLLNDERSYFNSLQETTSQVAIVAVLFCFGLSIVTWLWFRYRPGGHA